MQKSKTLKAAITIVAVAGIVLFTRCSSEDASAIPVDVMDSGKKVYATYCESCHMRDGAGVPRLNAPLIGSAYALGDKEKLITIALDGSGALANEPGRSYKNLMPSMAQLSNAEIAGVLTYIRNSFTNRGSLITAEDVKAAREKKNG